MTRHISIGITAYNEEGNIARLLNALLKQKTSEIGINEIIVISSGSTDRTNTIVEGFLQNNSQIRLIKQTRREGKASAINEFIKVANNEILVLESADTIPDSKTIETLCLPFENPIIGMTGAHPVPTNDSNNLMGYTSHLLWSLHNRIAMRRPKCGELVAFRKIFRSLPQDIATDEVWIEYEIKKRNLKTVYVPEAIVYNRGPETVSDFLKQRRRITCGHLDIYKKTKFETSTSKLIPILSAVLEEFPLKEPKKCFFLTCACALEGLGQLLGHYDYYTKKCHSVWEISKTTKRLDYGVA
jgi:biofilm PGA synthesis N-glycosyltransferase PgaC